MKFYKGMNNCDNFNNYSNGNDANNLYGLYAKAYFRAASILADELLFNGFREYEAYPVVFLYRHCLELYLKNILFKSDMLSTLKGVQDMPTAKQRNGHDIVALSKDAAAILHKLFPEDESLEEATQEILRITSEFEQMAPRADWYRYPATVQPKGKAAPAKQSVNLASFHGNPKKLMEKLETINFGFDIEADLAKIGCEWENAPNETARDALR